MGEIGNIPAVHSAVPSGSTANRDITFAGVRHKRPLHPIWSDSDDDFQPPKRRLVTQCSNRRRSRKIQCALARKQKDRAPVTEETVAQNREERPEVHSYPGETLVAPSPLSDTQSSETTRAVRSIQSFLLETRGEFEIGPAVR